MKTTTITKESAFALMTDTQGKIFSVDFIKKDGTLRHMVCRLGVSKGVTGVGLRFDPLAKNLLPVFDIEKAREHKQDGLDDETSAKRSYRMINLETVQQLTVSGTTFKVEG